MAACSKPPELRSIDSIDHSARGSEPGPQQPQTALVGGRHHLLDAVAVDVAGGEEAGQVVVEAGDQHARGRVGVGVEAQDLDPSAGHRLHRDVELVGAVAVDVVDQDLLGVAVAEVGHHHSGSSAPGT